MLTLVTQAALLAMVVSLASAAALVLKDRRPLYVRFAGLALSVSAYYLAVFVDALLPAGGCGGGLSRRRARHQRDTGDNCEECVFHVGKSRPMTAAFK